METDLSRVFFEKYFLLINRNIIVKLRNGNSIKGIIIGFYRGEPDSHDTYITGWHIIHPEDKVFLGLDTFGYMTGVIIQQKDIAEVYFEQDQSSMKF